MRNRVNLLSYVFLIAPVQAFVALLFCLSPTVGFADWTIEGKNGEVRFLSDSGKIREIKSSLKKCGALGVYVEFENSGNSAMEFLDFLVATEPKNGKVSDCSDLALGKVLYFEFKGDRLMWAQRLFKHLSAYESIPSGIIEQIERDAIAKIDDSKDPESSRLEKSQRKASGWFGKALSWFGSDADSASETATGETEKTRESKAGEGFDPMGKTTPTTAPSSIQVEKKGADVELEEGHDSLADMV